MKAGITSWCRGSITCATRHVGQATHTPFRENLLLSIVYGRDPKLPFEVVLCPPPIFKLRIDVDDYICHKDRKRISQIWSLAGSAINLLITNDSYTRQIIACA